MKECQSPALGAHPEPWLVDANPPKGISCSNLILFTWSQIVLVSLIATLSRGTLNALNALGGLGTGDVQTATMVNLLSSISFAFLSWLSGAVVNMLGFRNSCLLGSTTTTLTLTTLLLFTSYHIIPAWVVFLAASLDGIGSGILWTASGTILIKYPSEKKKGFASTILFAIYSLGAAFGGLLAFIMNYNQVTPVAQDLGEPVYEIRPKVGAGLTAGSYICMIGLAFSAVILSLFIVSEKRVINRLGQKIQQLADISCQGVAWIRPPSRSMSRLAPTFDQPPNSSNSSAQIQIRSPQTSGSSIKPSPSKLLLESSVRQARQLVATCRERSVQLMIFFSFASLFHQTYLFNGINYSCFNVRTRGLNCFMYWMGRIPAGFLHGYFVDDFRYTPRQRAFHGLVLLILHITFCQSLAIFFYTNVAPNPGDATAHTLSGSDAMVAAGGAVLAAGSAAANALTGTLSATSEIMKAGTVEGRAIAAGGVAMAAAGVAMVTDGALGKYDIMIDQKNTLIAFAIFFLYGGLDTVSQSFALWLFSRMGIRHPSRVPHYVAMFRCFQGLGISLAWFLDLSHTIPYHVQFGIGAVCWFVGLPGLIAVILKLENNEPYQSKYLASTQPSHSSYSNESHRHSRKHRSPEPI